MHESGKVNLNHSEEYPRATTTNTWSFDKLWKYLYDSFARARECSFLSERRGCLNPLENILPLVIRHQSIQHPERYLREDPQSQNEWHRRRQIFGQLAICVCLLSLQGFGAGNFKSLFEAIEKDQDARGNLTALTPEGQAGAFDWSSDRRHPHSDFYTRLNLSGTINSTRLIYRISNTCTGCWIYACDKQQVSSDMLEAVSR